MIYNNSYLIIRIDENAFFKQKSHTPLSGPHMHHTITLLEENTWLQVTLQLSSQFNNNAEVPPSPVSAAHMLGQRFNHCLLGYFLAMGEGVTLPVWTIITYICNLILNMANLASLVYCISNKMVLKQE